MDETEPNPLPRWSLGGWLSRRGRARNRWAGAMQRQDPAEALAMFRDALRQLEAGLPELSPMCLPCVQSMLDRPRLAALEEADFASIEHLASALHSYAADRDTAARILWQAAAARGARHQERPARDLYTRAFHAANAGSPLRTAAARELARHGGGGDDAVAVYVEQLARAGEDPLDTPLRQQLQLECVADLQSPTPVLTRAALVARRVEQAGLPIPGIDRVLGLHALLLDGDASAAAARFQSALAVDALDHDSRCGLVASRLRAGDNSAAVAALDAALQPDDRTISALRRAAATLKWLDRPESAEAAPESARSLAALGLERVLGATLVAAVGRLHLIEGDAALALERLAPLVVPTSEPRWCYHAAWAHLLNGNTSAIRACARTAAAWPAAWTISWLEAEFSSGGSKPATNAAEVLESSLQASRVAAARAIIDRDSTAIARALSSPIFRRLPRADREYWAGLAQLTLGEVGAGVASLETAARRLGHPRAALALAVRALEQGSHGRARSWLRLAGLPESPLTRLVQARIDQFEGHRPVAVRALESLLHEGQPHAGHALGNLALGIAAEACDAPTAQRRYQQAAAAFRAAGAVAGRIGTDAALLGDVAATLADANAPLAAGAFQSACEQRETRPWLAWVAAVAAIRSPGNVGPGNAARELTGLLARAKALNEAAACALATAAACACRSADHADATALCSLLAALAGAGDSDRLRAIVDVGLAHARLLHGVGFGAGMASEGSAVLTLQAAREALARGDPDGAAAAMATAAAPQLAPTLSRLASLCMGTPDAADPGQPQPMPDDPRLVAADHLVHAAVHLRAGRPREAAAAWMSGWNACSAAATRVLPLSRMLPVLGGDATETILRRAAETSPAAKELAALARWAEAMGHDRLASDLWPRALASDPAPPEAWRQQYARLCARLAVLARRSGRPGEAALELRDAADTLLSAANPAAGSTAGAAKRLTAGALLRHARACTAEAALGRLLAGPFPARGAPGRWRVLMETVERHTPLAQALRDGTDSEVAREWKRAQEAEAGDARLQHAWAVFQRERSLDPAVAEVERRAAWRASTAQWCLLLSSGAFWRYFGSARMSGEEGDARADLSAQEIDELMRTVVQELFAEHASEGAHALAAGRMEWAHMHLACLEACACDELQSCCAVPFSLQIDAARLVFVRDAAAAAIESWVGAQLAEATQALDDPQAIERLPPGICKAYADAVACVRPFIEIAEPNARVLCATLGWHNDWCYDLYRLKDVDGIRRLIGPARELAARLAPLAPAGAGHRLESQALSQHHLLRGFAESDPDVAIDHYDEALRWNPANTNAESLRASELDAAIDQQVTRALARARCSDFEAAYRTLEDVQTRLGGGETVELALGACHALHAQSLAQVDRVVAALEHARIAQRLAPQEEQVRELVQSLLDRVRAGEDGSR